MGETFNVGALIAKSSSLLDVHPNGQQIQDHLQNLSPTPSQEDAADYEYCLREADFNLDSGPYDVSVRDEDESDANKLKVNDWRSLFDQEELNRAY